MSVKVRYPPVPDLLLTEISEEMTRKIVDGTGDFSPACPGYITIEQLVQRWEEIASSPTPFHQIVERYIPY